MQAGELACMMHPEGHTIDTLNSADAIELTNKELQKENVTLYEPALIPSPLQNSVINR
jgi:hypothetical protein